MYVMCGCMICLVTLCAYGCFVRMCAMYVCNLCFYVCKVCILCNVCMYVMYVCTYARLC